MLECIAWHWMPSEWTGSVGIVLKGNDSQGCRHRRAIRENPTVLFSCIVRRWTPGSISFT
jgi:hypothetical protein